MKLLHLLASCLLYRAVKSVSEPEFTTTAPSNKVEEVQTALPLVLIDDTLEGVEEIVAQPIIPGGDHVKDQDENTAVNVRKPDVQILPMPIAVGEPNGGQVGKPDVQILPMPVAVGEPNGGQKPIDFSLDGYFYKGSKKIASYRIDFNGVHFKRDRKKRNKTDIDEMIDVVESPVVDEEEKEEEGEKEEEEVTKGSEETTQATTVHNVEPVDGSTHARTPKKDEASPTETVDTFNPTTDAPIETKETPVIDPTSEVPDGRQTTEKPADSTKNEKPDIEESYKSTVIPVSSDIVYTGAPPKPEFGPGKCSPALVFAFDDKAKRCLANSTQICTEAQWEAVKEKTFGACMRSAPRVAPADPNKTDCGVGYVYAQVPGEPSADLYGRRCADRFCPKEGTCVQKKTAAHCCIFPRWAHYG